MAEARRRPSLRLQLLAILMLPILLLLLVGAVVTYRVVLSYDNAEHDRGLVMDAKSVATLLRSEQQDESLSPQARYLLAYDTEGTNYFVVQSSRRGVLSSTEAYPTPPQLPAVDAEPYLFDTMIGEQPIRAVTLRIHAVGDPDDLLTITLGETLHSRKRLARDILLITLPLQGILIVSLLALIWIGVNYGLRSLNPMMRKLASREQGLAPITDAQVPREILPLTRTLDGLFARLREAIDVQENFVADAAHQLRTPLAGLRLHLERALHSSDPAATRESLAQMQLLTVRASRTATQLLSLMRAQSPLDGEEELAELDLGALVRETVTERVPDGLRAGIDLGYQGPDTPVFVLGSPAPLRDLLQNLLDNALTYSGRGTSVTVSLQRTAGHTVELAVEDSGPGVPEAYLNRLGERFFRVPDSAAGGTGLGLAIVLRIANRHHARAEFGQGTHGGLRVCIYFAERKHTT